MLKTSVKYLRLWPLVGLLYCLPVSGHANAVNFSRTNRDTTNDEIYKLAEQSPTFPGGPEEFDKFLSITLKYPEIAMKNNVTGIVYTRFVIEKDGSLSNFLVIRDPGSGLAEEAVRALKLSPKWTPGIQSGKAVRVQYTVPVRFALDTAHLAQVSSVPQDTSGANKIYTAVGVNPSFPGGEEAFGEFLRRNVRYPMEAKRFNTTGRAFIQFVVEADGSLTNFKTLRDPGNGLGAEALRVISLSPKWIPGTLNGKAVRVRYVVPINFLLAR